MKPDFAELCLKTPIYTLGNKSHPSLQQAGFVQLEGGKTLNAQSLAQSILESLPEAAAAASVTFLHGDKALDTLPAALREQQCQVRCIQAYTSRCLDAKDVETTARSHLSGQSAPLAVVVFSPSGVPSAQHLCSTVCVGARIITIGKTTAAAVLDSGGCVDAVAETPSPQGVVAALNSCRLRPLVECHTSP